MTKEKAYDILVDKINELDMWEIEHKTAEKTLTYILGIVTTLERLLNEGKDNSDI